MIKPRKPVIYIASPYRQGDISLNVRFQHEIFDELMSEEIVTPIAPHLSHYQQIYKPHTDNEWIKHNLSILNVCDGLLRLDSKFEKCNYLETASTGADKEYAAMIRLQKPVFQAKHELYKWVLAIWIPSQRAMSKLESEVA